MDIKRVKKSAEEAARSLWGKEAEVECLEISKEAGFDLTVRRRRESIVGGTPLVLEGVEDKKLAYEMALAAMLVKIGRG